MNTHTLTLLTIVAEALLKDRLIHEVRQAGAKGFTITEVSGEGSRQRRVSEILGDNIKIEVIAKRETADNLERASIESCERISEIPGNGVSTIEPYYFSFTSHWSILDAVHLVSGVRPVDEFYELPFGCTTRIVEIRIHL